MIFSMMFIVIVCQNMSINYATLKFSYDRNKFQFQFNLILLFLLIYSIIYYIVY